MRRRQVLTFITGTIVLGAGCIDSPSEGNESPSEGNESHSTGRIFIEVQGVDETEEDARITDYECASQSPILKEVLDEATEDESVTTEISSTEREDISETLTNCYGSREGPIYVKNDKETFKVIFLKQQV